MSDILARLHARALGSSLLLRPRPQFRFAPDQAAFDPPAAATMTMPSRQADAGPDPARTPDVPGRGADGPPRDRAPHTAGSGLAAPPQPERARPDARLAGTVSGAALRDGSEGQDGQDRAGRAPAALPPATGQPRTAAASAAGPSPERASDRSLSPPDVPARTRPAKPGSPMTGGKAGDIIPPAEAAVRLPLAPEATPRPTVPRPTAPRPGAPDMARATVPPTGAIASATAVTPAGADGRTPLRPPISATPPAATERDEPERHPGGSDGRTAAVDLTPPPLPAPILADEGPGRSAAPARPRPPIRETAPDPAVRVDIGRIEVALPAPAPPAMRDRLQPPPLMLKPRRAQAP